MPARWACRAARPLRRCGTGSGRRARSCAARSRGARRRTVPTCAPARRRSASAHSRRARAATGRCARRRVRGRGGREAAVPPRRPRVPRLAPGRRLPALQVLQAAGGVVAGAAAAATSSTALGAAAGRPAQPAARAATASATDSARRLAPRGSRGHVIGIGSSIRAAP